MFSAKILDKLFSYLNKHWVSTEIELGNSVRKTFSIYVDGLESEILKATYNYYMAEGKKFREEYNDLDYIHKVHSVLEFENEKIIPNFNRLSQFKILEKIYACLVTPHIDLFENVFLTLLENNRNNEHSMIYKILLQSQMDLSRFNVIFKTFVTKRGASALGALFDQSADTLNPSEFVDTCMEIYNTYISLIDFAFAGDKEFKSSLDLACKSFVNNTTLYKGKKTSPAEILASFADHIIKQGFKVETNDSNLNRHFDNIITVMRFIEDKDAFKDFYRRGLARRLISDLSSSFEAEQNMISKLKDACGYDFTNKLTLMFRDMDISQELNSYFIESLESKCNMDFYFKILNTAAWPLAASSENFNLPEDLSSLAKKYESFYTQRNQGRKLHWLYQHSKVEVSITLPSPKSNPRYTYTFIVSTFQYTILSMFNKASAGLKYEEILETTKLSKNIVDSALEIFLKARLILITSSNTKPQNTRASRPVFEPGMTFALNVNFKSNRLKINLNVPLRSEKKNESVQAHKAVSVNHQMSIQASIVRVMKTRKVATHNVLVNEVINQLENRFKPTIQEIKSAIDTLLEKEYIERSPDDNSTYNYLA
ncbi:hypothetical protein BB560_006956 [Smittium megazygosporum]|uniref:Cullin family profile domain-containing protein n=1 Tax=Smittium megazygosporum TaxID=133381 RepID=A0A2T9XZY3_9FUNG|nr:hypothetical protein BB560_006956 [Smittium megazygosporum]